MSNGADRVKKSRKLFEESGYGEGLSNQGLINMMLDYKSSPESGFAPFTSTHEDSARARGQMFRVEQLGEMAASIGIDPNLSPADSSFRAYQNLLPPFKNIYKKPWSKTLSGFRESDLNVYSPDGDKSEFGEFFGNEENYEQAIYNLGSGKLRQLQKQSPDSKRTHLKQAEWRRMPQKLINLVDELADPDVGSIKGLGRKYDIPGWDDEGFSKQDIKNYLFSGEVPASRGQYLGYDEGDDTMIFKKPQTGLLQYINKVPDEMIFEYEE